MNRGLLVRFGVSALVGAVVAVGVGVVAGRPQIVSTARAGESISLTGVEGNPLDFSLQPSDTRPLEPPPATASIQLTSFHAAGPSVAPGGEVEDPWWNASVPRIPPITQFDGGPLQAVNCLMAAGAMLARLGYGVVTTGSQMRALQDDQDGPTNFENLQNAVRGGWGIRFFSGALTALQLRALLYAGAGAVVAGIYGEIPVGLRVQKDFTGAHAVYIDAFRAPGPAGPAAYYVMDPIGRTWEGYRGDWWPAEHVERFAAALGGGRALAAWAFPGGAVPRDHPVLPPDAYPGAPGATPRPGESPAGDPMPTEDVPLTADPPVGEPPGGIPPFHDFDFRADVFEVKEPELVGCLAQPPPRGCPRGIVGVIDLDGQIAPLGTAPPSRGIEVLYATAIAPDTYQILIDAPPDTSSDLWFWGGNGSKIQAASVEDGFLDGRAVTIATISLDPEETYSFVATATGDGISAISTVGTLEVGS